MATRLKRATGAKAGLAKATPSLPGRAHRSTRVASRRRASVPLGKVCSGCGCCFNPALNDCPHCGQSDARSAYNRGIWETIRAVFTGRIYENDSSESGGIQQGRDAARGPRTLRAISESLGLPYLTLAIAVIDSDPVKSAGFPLSQREVDSLASLSLPYGPHGSLPFEGESNTSIRVRAIRATLEAILSEDIEIDPDGDGSGPAEIAAKLGVPFLVVAVLVQRKLTMAEILQGTEWLRRHRVSPQILCEGTDGVEEATATTR